jgi:fructose-bisphosphate aldolase class II
MPFIRDGRTLIGHAYDAGYTLPAFNVCSAEMIRACLDAAEELEAPLLLQTYPLDLEQIAPRQMAALVRSHAHESPVPVALHLDHGPGFEPALACLRAGFSSVMLDGAERPLDEVISACRRVADVAHAQGAAVEVAAESFNAGASTLTDPDEAARLRSEGAADMIAVSVGSEHGQVSHLDLPLLARIAAAVGGPLVLHGGSGISADDYREARSLGVVKANIGSALYRALRAVWERSSDAPHHRAVYARARASLAAVARDKLTITGAAGRASAALAATAGG